MQSNHNIQWFWFNPQVSNWVPVNNKTSSFYPNSPNLSIEEEYQSHLKKERSGQRVFHCFGDGHSSGIDYDKMETYCNSGRCLLTHEQQGIDDDHMTFKIRRIEE